jgi:alpha-galactosidase
MCLVSPWGDAFLEALVRLNSETGVTSYEWGAVAQYGCDAPGHGHGTDANTPEERADAYAFRIAPRLAGIAERLAQRVPGSVVDLDVTGPGRPVGLAFLRAGRYSLVASRSTYGYDEWIPSELFLTHALPDDPLDAQLVGVASLILAHGGMRGSLRTVPENGAAFLARVVGLWREVRDSMSGASPVRTTVAGGSGEVHEKIDADGRGAIVVFSAAAGRRRYVSEHVVVPDHWATPGVQVRSDGAGYAVLDLPFEKPGAAIVFFGATGARQVEVR